MKFTEGLVAQLSLSLKDRLMNTRFNEAYSTGNDELVLVFSDSQSFFTLRLLWEAQQCFLFFSNENLPKPTPHYWFFNELKGLQVLQVFQHPGNRSLQIDFENSHQLVFKLYDGLSNVLLLKEGQLLYHFRKNIGNDYHFTPEQLTAKPGKQPEPFDIPVQELFTWFNENNRKFLSQYVFEEEKRKIVHQLQVGLKKTKQFADKTQQALIQLKEAVSLEEIGHILMANLHVIPEGAGECILHDFYRNIPITVKLKKELSPLQNAELYYRKGKNKKTEEKLLEERIDKALIRLKQLEADMVLAEKAQTLKELKPFRHPGSKKEKESRELFKQFMYEGFTIWVGKNAANNDELTFRHSHKTDLWLHARDVSGSHVIIRQRQGMSFPERVIRYAASLAAWYSKAKGSSLVPVVYCERKFVRKPKGAAPGEVMHEQGTMIMAEPRNEPD